MVLAPLQDPLPVVPLLPTRNPSLGSGILLVVSILLDPIPPHATRLLHRPTTSQAGFLPALQPLHPDLHVVPLAGVLPVVSGPGHHHHDVGLFRRVRVPVLDGNRIAQRVLSVRVELPDGALGLQPGMPRWGPVAALLQGRVQRNWRVDLQLCAQWRYSASVLELLRENALEEEKEWFPVPGFFLLCVWGRGEEG